MGQIEKTCYFRYILISHCSTELFVFINFFSKILLKNSVRLNLSRVIVHLFLKPIRSGLLCFLLLSASVPSAQVFHSHSASMLPPPPRYPSGKSGQRPRPRL